MIFQLISDIIAMQAGMAGILIQFRGLCSASALPPLPLPDAP